MVIGDPRDASASKNMFSTDWLWCCLSPDVVEDMLGGVEEPLLPGELGHAGEGQAVPVQVVKRGLGAVGQQQLVERSVSRLHHRAVAGVVGVVETVGETLHHHPVLPEPVHPVPRLQPRTQHQLEQFCILVCVARQVSVGHCLAGGVRGLRLVGEEALYRVGEPVALQGPLRPAGPPGPRPVVEHGERAG